MQLISIILVSSVLFLVGCGQNGSSSKPISSRAGKPANKISKEKPGAGKAGEKASEKASETKTGEKSTNPSAATHAITGTVTDKTQTPPIRVDGSTPTVKASTVTGSQNLQTKPLTDKRILEGLAQATDQEQPAQEGSANKSLSAVEILQTRAYREHLIPLFQKIRQIHAGTADRFELALQSVSIVIAKDAEASPSDAEVHSQAVAMVHAILLNLSTGATSAASAASADKADLAYNAAHKLLVKGSVLTAPALYDQMVELQIDMKGWKLDSMSVMNVASELIKISQQSLSLLQDKVAEAGDEKTAEKTCVLNAQYMGLEKGLDIRVSRPDWREFKMHMDINKTAQAYTLKNSTAGADFTEIELLNKASDAGYKRLTIRYKKTTVNGKTERAVDHIVLQKLSAQGDSERTVICKILK